MRITACFFGFCPQTERATSWFQSVGKLSVTGPTVPSIGDAANFRA
jgi:hypothetical protein